MCFKVVLLWFFVGLKSLEIINENISNQTITCHTDTDCIITCNSNNNSLCQNTLIICQNINYGECKLTCIGSNTCQNITLTAVNVNSVEIFCGIQNGITILYI